MRFDGVFQQALAHGDVTLLDGGQRQCVQKFGPLGLRHLDDGKIVFALRTTGQNQVVLGGEPGRIIGDRLGEQLFRAGRIAAVEILTESDTAVKKLWANGDYLKKGLREAGFDTGVPS